MLEWGRAFLCLSRCRFLFILLRLLEVHFLLLLLVVALVLLDGSLLVLLVLGDQVVHVGFYS